MEPTDNLSSDTMEYFQQCGVHATKVSDVTGGKDQMVNRAIQEGIDRVNAKATSNAQRIQKWAILGKDFSVSGGELGEYHLQAGINVCVIKQHRELKFVIFRSNNETATTIRAEDVPP